MPEIMTIPAPRGTQDEDLGRRGPLSTQGLAEWLLARSSTGPGPLGPLPQFTEWERLESFLPPGPS